MDPQDPIAPTGAPTDETATADASDGGWSVDSHSSSMDAPPADTTEDPQSELDREVAAEAPTARAAAEPTGAAVRKPKPKQTFQARIDELTGQRHSTERELAAERSRREDLERRIAALESPKTAAAPAEAASAAAPPTDDGLPDPPKYVDYETDEDYTAAVKEYKARTSDVINARIAATIDARLATERDASGRAEYQRTIDARLAAMNAAHPDFHELIEANAETFKDVKNPFIQDIVQNTDDGAEFLYDLASDPDAALALGALPLPTRPLADAVRDSPAARTLMKHFATPEGREDFLRLRALPPISVLREVGRLEERLTAVNSGPAVGAVRPITNAVPPAKPPVGSPRARVIPGAGSPPADFDSWMADEDRKELESRRRAIGIPASA